MRLKKNQSEKIPGKKPKDNQSKLPQNKIGPCVSRLARAASAMANSPERAGERGYSLLEMLTTAGILVFLAGIAIPSYMKHTRASHETWVKWEMSELATLMRAAKGVDGHYHQFIYQMGYRPKGVLFGTVGLPGVSTQPCCANYDSCGAGFLFYRPGACGPPATPPTGLSALMDSASICRGTGYTESCQIKGAASALGSNPVSGLTLDSDCAASVINRGSWCDCDQFTLAGVTAYGASSAPNPSDKGHFTLNHERILCAAKKSTKLEVKARGLKR